MGRVVHKKHIENAQILRSRAYFFSFDQVKGSGAESPLSRSILSRTHFVSSDVRNVFFSGLVGMISILVVV